MRIITAIIVCLFLFASVGLYRLNELNKIPVDVDNYSTYNLIEIYILGVVMSGLAYPIYPEIAIEHMALYSKDKPQRHSNFFMSSKVVQNAVDNYSKPVMLTWHADSYMFGNPEARVALALNGAVLSKTTDEIHIDVPIKYPRNSLVKLLPMVEVQEGLFWVLQQKGWYHTGTMTWTYEI
jgi:hypothetical protein